MNPLLNFLSLFRRLAAPACAAHVFVAELIDVIDTGTGNGAHRSARTLHFNENVVRPVVQARIDVRKPAP